MNHRTVKSQYPISNLVNTKPAASGIAVNLIVSSYDDSYFSAKLNTRFYSGGFDLIPVFVKQQDFFYYGRPRIGKTGKNKSLDGIHFRAAPTGDQVNVVHRI